MNSESTLTALAHAKKCFAEHKIKNVRLFDHKPVLRIQVTEADFERILDMRTELVEQLKSTGFRFIAIDLEQNSEN